MTGGMACRCPVGRESNRRNRDYSPAVATLAPTRRAPPTPPGVCTVPPRRLLMPLCLSPPALISCRDRFDISIGPRWAAPSVEPAGLQPLYPQRVTLDRPVRLLRPIRTPSKEVTIGNSWTTDTAEAAARTRPAGAAQAEGRAAAGSEGTTRAGGVATARRRRPRSRGHRRGATAPGRVAGGRAGHLRGGRRIRGRAGAQRLGVCGADRADSRSDAARGPPATIGGSGRRARPRTSRRRRRPRAGSRRRGRRGARALAGRPGEPNRAGQRPSEVY